MNQVDFSASVGAGDESVEVTIVISSNKSTKILHFR
jgi:hypothetical protein